MSDISVLKTFSDLFTKHKSENPETKSFSINAFKWFHEAYRDLDGYEDPNRVRKDPGIKITADRRVRTGRLYMFGYSAKHSETLKYWDAFPLTIVLNKTKKGFTGLNLHYLHPIERTQLFGDLVRLFLLAPGGKDAKAKLKIPMELLRQSKRLSLNNFTPCLKNYLWENVQTQMLLVPRKHWEAALFLPSEDFQKEDKNLIWKESRRAGSNA